MEGFQVPVFKGDDEPPVIVPAYVEHCFVGVEPIGKYVDNTNHQTLMRVEYYHKLMTLNPKEVQCHLSLTSACFTGGY